jgi:hypothetical protein
MAEQVGQMLHGLREGSSKEVEGHYYCPVPPSLDDASIAAAANDNVGGDWRQQFCGSTFNLSPHTVTVAFKQCWRQQQCRSYKDNVNASIRNGNNQLH